MLQDHFKIVAANVPALISDMYVRTGYYRTNDKALRDEVSRLEAPGMDAAELESASQPITPEELQYAQAMPHAMRSFIAEQASFILDTRDRRMANKGRFSCMGAIGVWQEGRSYFVQPANAQTLINDDNVMRAFLASVSDYAQREKVEEYQINIEKDPKKTQPMNAVFYGVIDEFFQDRGFALVYFAKLLKRINDVDAQTHEVEKGYSRDPLSPDYIISIRGIPYFANISHGYELDDHQSTKPSILLVPQAIFEQQKMIILPNGQSMYDTWSPIIRDNLVERYGTRYRGFNSNGKTSPLPNFLFFHTQEEAGLIADAMGLSRADVVKLVDPTYDDARHRCPMHGRQNRAGQVSSEHDIYAYPFVAKG